MNFSQIKKIPWVLRAVINKIWFGKIGALCYIGSPCFIAKKKALFLGDKVRIYPGLRVEIQDNGCIEFGNNISIGQNFHIVSMKKKLKIGDNVTISANVFISNCDHTFDNIPKSALEKPLISKDTYIANNCFIGYGAVILAGTYLGENCVVGANSVVRGMFPKNSIIAGNPAKILKKIDEGKDNE